MYRQITETIDLIKVEGYACRRDTLTIRQAIIREAAIWIVDRGDLGGANTYLEIVAGLTQDRQVYYDGLSISGWRSLFNEVKYNTDVLFGVRENGSRSVVDDVIPLAPIQNHHYSLVEAIERHQSDE